MATPQLTIDAVAGMNLTVTQPITFGGALILRGATTFSATGAGSLAAPMLTFSELSSAARTWTINPTSITISPGAAIPYSGVTRLITFAGGGSDTFNVTPSAATRIDVGGGNPAPPALPGDALNVNVAGAITPYLAYTANASGYAGDYTFGNRQLVHFDTVESLSPNSTDLAITKDDGGPNAVAGGTVTYTVVASNVGPLGLGGVNVVDTFPSSLSNIHWTCAASPGSSCSPSGSGGLNQLANLAAGGTATYTVTATVDPHATGTVTNSVTIAPPAGSSDPTSANNSASDTDTVIAAAEVPTLSGGLLLLLGAILAITALLRVGRA
jgi:uncharacterized repeat protein (TIGR01451 family)